MYSTCIAERLVACECQKKSVVYETECRHIAVQRGLHHFDRYRMAPPDNDTFDFLMTETTCSDVQSDMEDMNLDSVLQQLKSPSYEEPQHCLSDIGGISDTAEGFDELLCDQSSPQLTVEDNISTSRVTSSSGVCEQLSPGHSSSFMCQSPQSMSVSSVAATAGTHCDLSWPSLTDDESVTEGCSSPSKGEKTKAVPGTTPKPYRQSIPNYQTMTPWTNDNLTGQQPLPSANREIRCFPLDAQMSREQDLIPKSLASNPSHLGSPAVTEMVYSLTTSLPSMSVPGITCGQTATKRPPHQIGDIPHMTREKRFRKTAEALQKCGLWDIAMKTGNLIKRNSELQKEIERFRAEATVFLKDVVQNPENKELMESWTTSTPLTLGNRACVSDGFESNTVTTTVCMARSKVSDGNSSTTSGYASYTEGGSRQTCPA